MAVIRTSSRKRASRYKPTAMVKKTKAQKTYQESSYFTRGTNPQNSVVFRGTGFPDRLTTNLVYAESFVLDPSTLTIAPFKVWRVNSLFDPDQALGGGQPTYFDQLAAVYARYIVNGAKITATFSQSTQTAANIGPYLCGIQMGNTTTLPSSTASKLMSLPNTVSRLVSKDDGTVKVCQTYSAKNTFPGQSADLVATNTSNPATSWYAKVFASPQGTDTEVPINVTVIIEFNATFSDVKEVIDG